MYASLKIRANGRYIWHQNLNEWRNCGDGGVLAGKVCGKNPKDRLLAPVEQYKHTVMANSNEFSSIVVQEYICFIDSSHLILVRIHK